MRKTLLTLAGLNLVIGTVNLFYGVPIISLLNLVAVIACCAMAKKDIN